MQVQEVMTRQPLACDSQSNLAEVAHLMWRGDCGIVPLTDEAGKLTGVITDRDICIAASTRNQAPAQIRASELPRGDLYTCRPDDDAKTVLTMMRDRRIRRVPVTAADGTLLGIVSINDIVLTAGAPMDITAADVLETLKAICAHRPSLAAPAKAAGAGASR